MENSRWALAVDLAVGTNIDYLADVKSTYLSLWKIANKTLHNLILPSIHDRIIPKKTEISVFFVRYSVFFGLSNTDVGIGFLEYRGFGSVFGIPTHD
jgi:hypothetical protein